MSEQQPKPIVSVKRRYPYEPTNWRELNPLATDPQPKLTRTEEPNGHIDKNSPHELARRRRARLGFIDGQVIKGKKTWQVELVRRGVRPERSKLPDKEKHRKPAVRKRPEDELLYGTRKRGDWREIVANRNRRDEAMRTRSQWAQDPEPAQVNKVSQKPEQRDINIRPSHTPLEVTPTTPMPRTEGFVSKVPSEAVKTPRYPRTLAERLVRKLVF